MIFKYLDLKLFLISLSVGLLYIYLAEEYKKIVFIYPTPTNVHNTQYKDKSDECFEYELTEVKCPAQVQTIPMQR